jgi:hypothetical protein
MVAVRAPNNTALPWQLAMAAGLLQNKLNVLNQPILASFAV